MTRARPHIVHVIGTLNTGGVQNLVLGLARTPPLDAYRHTAVCLFGAHGGLADDFALAGIATRECPIPWPSRLPLPSYRVAKWVREQLAITFPLRLARLLRELDADLVHMHVSTRVDLQTAAVLERARLPVVWGVHGSYTLGPSDVAQWERAVARIRRGRGQIVVGAHAVADHVVARGIVRRDELATIHYGIDIAAQSGPRVREPAWRERHGIPADAIVFGTMGRLVEVKGLDVLITAVRELARDHANVRVLIAGQGPVRDALAAQIAGAGLDGIVQLLGYLPDGRAFLNELDVFVLPSRSEGFPLALIEAAAAGLPCIATRVGGVAELLDDETGRILPPEDPVELAAAMRELLDPATRARYASHSRPAAARFSYESCAVALDAIYVRLLGTTTRRGERASSP